MDKEISNAKDTKAKYFYIESRKNNAERLIRYKLNGKYVTIATIILDSRPTKKEDTKNEIIALRDSRLKLSKTDRQRENTLKQYEYLDYDQKKITDSFKLLLRKFCKPLVLKKAKNYQVIIESVSKQEQSQIEQVIESEFEKAKKQHIEMLRLFFIRDIDEIIKEFARTDDFCVTNKIVK